MSNNLRIVLNTYGLNMAAFMMYQQSWVVAERLHGPSSPKYLLSSPSQKMFADPGLK